MAYPRLPALRCVALRLPVAQADRLDNFVAGRILSETTAAKGVAASR